MFSKSNALTCGPCEKIEQPKRLETLQEVATFSAYQPNCMRDAFQFEQCCAKPPVASVDLKRNIGADMRVTIGSREPHVRAVTLQDMLSLSRSSLLDGTTTPSSEQI